jgi:hypothetical protein
MTHRAMSESLPPSSEPKTPTSTDASDEVRPKHADAKPRKPEPDPTRYGDWEKNGRCIDF